MLEQELIYELKQKNEFAFKLLVEKFSNKVFHTALNILQNHAEAEDITQETFIKVFQFIDEFKQESTLSTWILKIATNKSIDKLRAKKRQEILKKFLGFGYIQNDKTNKSHFSHPSVSIENKEKASVLFKAIESLPEKQRIAFTLIKVQGLRYDEVCAILGQNTKAVESLVSRAKQNLQLKLESYYKNNL